MGRNSPLDGSREITEPTSEVGSGETERPDSTDRKQNIGSSKLGKTSDQQGSERIGSKGTDEPNVSTVQPGNGTKPEADNRKGNASNPEQTSGHSEVSNSRNFIIKKGIDVAPRGDISKITANIAAIKLLKVYELIKPFQFTLKRFFIYCSMIFAMLGFWINVAYRHKMLHSTPLVHLGKTQKPPNQTIKRLIEYPKRDLNPHSREAKGF